MIQHLSYPQPSQQPLQAWQPYSAIPSYTTIRVSNPLHSLSNILQSIGSSGNVFLSAFLADRIRQTRMKEGSREGEERWRRRQSGKETLAERTKEAFLNLCEVHFSVSGAAFISCRIIPVMQSTKPTNCTMIGQNKIGLCSSFRCTRDALG